jgi:fructose-1,6-bisphosphatase
MLLKPLKNMSMTMRGKNKILYNKTPEEIKETIEWVAKESFSGYTNEPGYFLCVDPIDGNEHILVFSSKLGTIEQIHQELGKITGVPKKYFGKEEGM